MEKRIITLNSQTSAIRAHRALTSNGIRAKVVRLSPSQSKRGCGHGVEVSASDLKAATSCLYYSGINYSDVI
ncbi:MAG: DUF3343 domain-containing protein [Clostridia bacterium]|nr:DUF3343 domain-containing protein [Clostridia bacterium]